MLPATVNEYMVEKSGASPAMVMDALTLAEKYRGQLESFCTVTRYSLYAEMNNCVKGEDLRVQTVEWADVAGWAVPAMAVPAD